MTFPEQDTPRPEETGASVASQSAPLRGVYIGVDATNPTLILRIRSFRKAGVELTSFTFRRHKFNTGFQPDWVNIHLGDTVDRRYLDRLPALVRALRRMLKHGDVFRDADFIYARNMDLLVLGHVARMLTRSKAKLVYEVEDVQAIFFKKTFGGALFRRLERWLLRHVDLLVVMSPGFLRGYFEPVQGWDGPSFVLENKLQLGDRPEAPTPAGRVWEDIADRWVIGWFGTLRCPKSMALLEEIAEALGPRVEIYTRGYPTETGLEAYREIVERHPNWTYDGEYTIPDDLEDMYGRVHFSWCLDFLDEEGNSPLLLACRMYQGGFYGSVPLVAEGSEMERWLERAGVGHAFPAPHAASIIEFLKSVTPAEYRKERARIMAERRALFLEDGSDMRALLETMRKL
ncbi:glycosyltransferase [Poseidonocella sp. HB161398]|uniref:glycosyltransferase n=1 Tax=Poseidonocella sp. HB161398 TaxID=2320855 RepID=UPI0011095CAE|nr:glycosyltransferase [Poseidonocella sp. HB161398]